MSRASAPVVMSDRKSKEEILKEIDELTLLLQEQVRIEDVPADAREARYQALLSKYTGQRIRITLPNDPLFGCEGLKSGPHGKSKSPLFWRFLVLTGPQAGEIKWKQASSFKILPRAREPMDEDASH